MFKKETDDTG